MRMRYYHYDVLTDTQRRGLDPERHVISYLYDEEMKAPPNPFRCVGIDWDKYQASSSILVLDYDIEERKFFVIKRIEVPRSEYSLDNAVNWVIKINEIYNPSWIFCDRGYGDYQIERLHIYGDEHPYSGLKNKVVGWQFKNTLDVIDPVKRTMTKENLKPFMVNQLALAFERERIMLSPFDENLHKQLVDYCVERITEAGLPKYTSKNEHFVDALGLAYLAFVLKFPDITQGIKKIENSSKIEHSQVQLGVTSTHDLSAPISNPWKNLNQIGKDPGERRGDYQQWVKVPMGAKKPSFSSRSSWGSRGIGNNISGGRSLWR